MQLSDILYKYREESYSKRDMGTRFEELMARYLMTDPVYASDLESVVLWNDFHDRAGFGRTDVGIDLVAKTKGGEYWAVQCKLYKEDSKVSKGDLDSFLSTSGKTFTGDGGEQASFSRRMVIATINEWGANAYKVIENQVPPVMLVTLRMLEEAAVEWGEIFEGVHGSGARKEKHTLRPHQQEALDSARDHFSKEGRGMMIMACGTGKTFTSLKIAEALTEAAAADGRTPCVLFLAPSIALVGQTLREWMSHTDRGIMPIAVCSDTSVTKKRTVDSDGERVEYLGMPATTDPFRIVSEYRRADDLAVIFSTYQSIDAVIEAQRADPDGNGGLPAFDLIICDEAHRTTGVRELGGKEGYFTKVHSDDNISGRKRLYMTATPRVYGVKGKEKAKDAAAVLCSMDDEEQYGKEFYRISFGKAVEAELLTDYKVLIMTVKQDMPPDSVKGRWGLSESTGDSGRERERERERDSARNVDVDADCKLWGCLNAFAKRMATDETIGRTDPGHMRSVVSFASTIRNSKSITERFIELAQLPDSPLHLEAEHIDGSMNALTRDSLLNWLKDEEEGRCRLLSNVRCLSEGVDVPALDAVVFMNPKGSLVDIVQSVGRVMRKAEGKKYGYIIIPVVVAEDDDPEKALDDNEDFNVVWQVLRALRSHDERLEAEINTFMFRKSSGTGRDDRRIIHDWIESDQNPGPNTPWIQGGQYTLDDFSGDIYARLVLKVGDRDYFENWAKKVAEVMPDLVAKLTQICRHEDYGYKQYKGAFNRYLKGLRSSVNDVVSEEDAIDMLAQQVITKPIFKKLFGDEGFTKQNSVSQAIDAMLEEIHAKDGLREIDDRLGEFYDSVNRTLEHVNTKEGKQRVITALYEKFFKNAFPKSQMVDGIVYTRISIVDFIINSVSDVMQTEFSIGLGDEGVNILDPFSGTGTFIARLMESSIISKENLERKFREELFANEITLMAYYIAAVNIENTYAMVTGADEYVPFGNILLTDTFNIEKICESGAEQTTLSDKEYFIRNKSRIKREHAAPITVIMSNPPYGALQKSASDDAKKRTYRDGVDRRIAETYLDDGWFENKKGNVNSVYDNYVRAFRWATDRLRGEDGVVAFVTPNGWLTGNAFVGFRKTLEREFSKIYVFNLRGDATTQGELRRREGDGVFADGSRTGIAVTVLIYRKNYKGNAKVYYAKASDYMKLKEKFELLEENGSFHAMEKKKKLETLHIKENGDWIIERNEVFQDFVPLAGNTHRKFDKHEEETIFIGYTSGYRTNRDAWAYNFSKDKLKQIKSDFIEGYMEQLNRGVMDREDPRTKWSTPIRSRFKSKRKLHSNLECITTAIYRPFVKTWFDNDSNLNEVGQMPRIFPTPDAHNLIICVSGVGAKKNFSCLMTDYMTDIQLMANGQCFPLYWYEDTGAIRARTKQLRLTDGGEDIIRHDGISDHASEVFRSRYGESVTKEDIFFYIYGYLHAPEYADAFSADLMYSLPRIGLVKDVEKFRAFTDAGRKLADLHLNYEEAEIPDGLRFVGNMDVADLLDEDILCRVEKMRLDPKRRRLTYNKHLTIEEIPEEVFEYIVNGRSALAWLVDRYQIRTDKESGIINDPNDFDGGRYILELVLSVMGMSVKTMEIVKGLPKLDLEPED